MGRHIYTLSQSDLATSMKPFGKFWDEYTICLARHLLTFSQYVLPDSSYAKTPARVLLLCWQAAVAALLTRLSDIHK
jgi:hypothetical protein